MRSLIKLFFCFLFINLGACGPPDFRQMLAPTERIEVVFYQNDQKQIDSSQTFFVRQKEYIKFFIQHISKEEDIEPNCPVQGKMKFVRARIGLVLLEAEFSLNPDCGYIILKHKDQSFVRKISPKDLEYLNLAKIYKDFHF